MNDSDVYQFREAAKKTIVIATLTNGNKFAVKSIKYSDFETVTTFKNGTTAAPKLIKSLDAFSDVKAAQKFLLKKD